jgi:hypothetical protein
MTAPDLASLPSEVKQIILHQLSHQNKLHLRQVARSLRTNLPSLPEWLRSARSAIVGLGRNMRIQTCDLDPIPWVWDLPNLTGTTISAETLFHFTRKWMAKTACRISGQLVNNSQTLQGYLFNVMQGMSRMTVGPSQSQDMRDNAFHVTASNRSGTQLVQVMSDQMGLITLRLYSDRATISLTNTQYLQNWQFWLWFALGCIQDRNPTGRQIWVSGNNTPPTILAEALAIVRKRYPQATT